MVWESGWVKDRNCFPLHDFLFWHEQFQLLLSGKGSPHKHSADRVLRKSTLSNRGTLGFDKKEFFKSLHQKKLVWVVASNRELVGLC